MTPATPPPATRRAQTTYDIAVIGGGVVGAAIARELGGYQLTVALVEARVRRRRRHQQGQHRHLAHRL